MKKIIIDTDPGIDDVLAILYALHDNQVNISAITTVHGNASVEQTFENTKTLFRVIEAHQNHSENEKELNDIPWKIYSKPVISKGAAGPLGYNNVENYDHPIEVHGVDGLGGVLAKSLSAILDTFKGFTVEKNHKPLVHEDISTLYTISHRDSADEILFQLSNNDPNTISIAALGPLTNIAIAMERDPELKILSRMERMYIMGGCIHQPCPGGNVTPYAEFNFYADPCAADKVVGSGLPIVIVPLDVTEKCRLRYSVYQQTVVPIAQKAPLPSFVSSFIEHLYLHMAGLYEDEMFQLADFTKSKDRSRINSVDSAVKLNITENHGTLLDLGNEERVPSEVGLVNHPKSHSQEELNNLIESEKAQHRRTLHSTSLAMHDPLAIGVLLDPSIVTKTVQLRVQVETEENAKTRGMTLVDGRKWKKRIPIEREREQFVMKLEAKEKPCVDVVFQVDNNLFFARFMSYVFGIGWEPSKHEWLPL